MYLSSVAHTRSNAPNIRLGRRLNIRPNLSAVILCNRRNRRKSAKSGWCQTKSNLRHEQIVRSVVKRVTVWAMAATTTSVIKKGYLLGLRIGSQFWRFCYEELLYQGCFR